MTKKALYTILRISMYIVANNLQNDKLKNFEDIDTTSLDHCKITSLFLFFQKQCVNFAHFSVKLVYIVQCIVYELGPC